MICLRSNPQALLIKVSDSQAVKILAFRVKRVRLFGSEDQVRAPSSQPFGLFPPQKAVKPSSQPSQLLEIICADRLEAGVLSQSLQPTSYTIMDAAGLRTRIQATLDSNADVRRQAELDLRIVLHA